MPATTSGDALGSHSYGAISRARSGGASTLSRCVKREEGLVIVIEIVDSDTPRVSLGSRADIPQA